jgi:xylan 1,4-beta-xylosidase
MVRNPILPGFNADPSILRVGDNYYIANSTFEWYPGVQIHHSKDLANWDLICRPLSRKSQLDMRGDPDSCGKSNYHYPTNGNLIKIIRCMGSLLNS